MRWGRVIGRIVAATVVLFVAVIGGLIAFGGAAPPPVLESVAAPFEHVDFSDLPKVETYAARDGAALAFRGYPGDPAKVVVMIHGSSGSSSTMHVLGKTLAGAGLTAYALDLRGHGRSGPHGDIGYIGQLDDDLADFMALIGPRHPGARFALVGFSSGGGFALRIAGGRYGALFDRYLLLSPYLRYDAPTSRPAAGGWTSVATGRIIGLSILDGLGLPLFQNLPVVLFAVPPKLAGVQTASYSYRLALNFAPDADYLGDLKRVQRPIALMVGADDEIFRADQYAPLLQPAKPDLAITVLPALGHIDMVTNPTALDAIAEALTAPPAAS